MKRKVFTILIPILICFGVGGTASYFQSDAIKNWYPYLNKPALTPPDVVFPIAWSILYVCMGVSIGLVLLTRSPRKTALTALFVIQLLFNFGWSILFFYLRNPFLGLIDIVLLDIFVVIYAIRSYPVNKAASILFVPYILWVLFATYLNGYILMNNPVL